MARKRMMCEFALRIVNNMKRYRKKRKLSTRKWGKIIGFSHNHIAAVEREDRRPSFEMIDKYLVHSELNLIDFILDWDV